MKKFIQILWLIGILFIINSCVIFNAFSIMSVNKEINASVLSSENEDFQKKSGINLTYVKRGLWSMQSSYKNKMINFYFKSLMDNRLVFSLDENVKELAQQKTIDNTIIIVINNQFQYYTEYEKSILLVAATSTLALLSDENFNKNEVPNMFFNFINSYDTKEIPGIINAQWFKDRKILITNNSIIIG